MTSNTSNINQQNISRRRKCTWVIIYSIIHIISNTAKYYHIVSYAKLFSFSFFQNVSCDIFPTIKHTYSITRVGEILVNKYIKYGIFNQ